MTDRNDADETIPKAPPRSAFLNEDWLATIVGLAILGLALLGLIPKTVLW